MKKKVISVTEAARNFADCVNRVRYQNMTFVLVKNGVPVARLVPEENKAFRGRDVAQVLRSLKLPEAEAKAWRRDLNNARKTLTPPTNKWE